jgi:hypothetical protein
VITIAEFGCFGAGGFTKLFMAYFSTIIQQRIPEGTKAPLSITSTPASLC